MTTKIIIPQGYIVKPAYIISLDSIPTSKDSISNGSVIPILNIAIPDTRPIELAYLTTCLPNSVKGPHVHTGDKLDRFMCVRGFCKVSTRNEQTFEKQSFYLCEDIPALLYIPPYNSHAIDSMSGATILSLCTERYYPGHYNQVDVDWSEE